MRGEQAESMVYYVDKIQELENEVARIRSLRSSDKLKDKVVADEEEDDVENAAVNFQEIAASHNIQPSRVSVERIQLTEQVLLHISYIQAPVCSFKKSRKYT